MAVIQCIEDWRARTVAAQAGLDGASGQLVRRWHVEFDGADTPSHRPVLALTASHGGQAVPAYWDVHPADADYVARSKAVDPGEGPFQFVVTVTYEYHEDPLNQPYSVEFIPQSTQEAIDKGADDAELCNSAKEPFDPPIQEEFYDFSMVIRRNEAAFDITTANVFLNTVNNAIFSVVGRNGQTYQFAAGQVRCKSIGATEQRHGATWYWQVTYEFVVRDDGWKRRILDQGFRQLIGGEYVQITDADGNPLTQPAKLDGSGQLLAAAADPVFLEFETKHEAAFGGFAFTV